MRLRNRGASVVEFMIWLSLAGIVFGSTLTWYQSAQRQNAALEVSRMLDHLVTNVRTVHKAKESYDTYSRGYVMFYFGFLIEDFMTREYGSFMVGRTNALGGELGESFRIIAPYIPQDDVCADVVRFSVVNLKPVRVLRNNVVVMEPNAGMAVDEVVAAACGTDVGRVAWDFM
jgi:hypothetical protein